MLEMQIISELLLAGITGWWIGYKLMNLIEARLGGKND